ncbi:MAG: hypothetical protein R3F17_02000 [Planctomycetota bacterium]
MPIIDEQIDSTLFQAAYGNVFEGPEAWRAIAAPAGDTFEWDPASTYVKHPPYFEGMSMTPGAVHDIDGARVLGLFRDSITTDHISPAGSIAESSPAGKYLKNMGVAKATSTRTARAANAVTR